MKVPAKVGVMYMNLARKWRSRHFDEIVGQSLVVRLVKNSLFRNAIAPAYLLSGTRGCGKTSIARIFAAALNCHALQAFQKNPQQSPFPCLTCLSCTAMRDMNHPDFIEIDAASHTGVDNVRQIVEASSFVPVLGGKKIYLIDEAHMLSKAAFNAFLKVLEEPPLSVVFMLATTDVHKIIDTVSSRCFHLFFEPISQDAITSHLEHVCNKEGIAYEREALSAVAQESGGSLRDALNFLERLRIAYDSVSKKAVVECTGTIDEERICGLLLVVFKGSPVEILTYYEANGFTSYSALIIWKKLVTILRSCLCLSYGMTVDTPALSKELEDQVRVCSYEKLLRFFELCYRYEPLLVKTAVPHSVLETMLLSMAQKEEPKKVDAEQKSSLGVVREAKKGVEKSEFISREKPVATQEKPIVAEQRSLKQAPSVAPENNNAGGSKWNSFLQALEGVKDPLVLSIFRQALEHRYNADSKILTIIFSEDIVFFKDMLENTKRVWLALFARFYDEDVTVTPLFTGKSARANSSSKIGSPSATTVSSSAQEVQRKPLAPQKNDGQTADIRKDPEKWQKSSMILDLFPGTISTLPDKESL